MKGEGGRCVGSTPCRTVLRAEEAHDRVSFASCSLRRLRRAELLRQTQTADVQQMCRDVHAMQHSLGRLKRRRERGRSRACQKRAVRGCSELSLKMRLLPLRKPKCRCCCAGQQKKVWMYILMLPTKTVAFALSVVVQDVPAKRAGRAGQPTNPRARDEWRQGYFPRRHEATTHGVVTPLMRDERRLRS